MFIFKEMKNDVINVRGNGQNEYGPFNIYGEGQYISTSEHDVNLIK